MKKYFEENNCVLLENSYINNHTKMRYICSCGNISKIIFSDFQNGSRCQKCGRNKQANTNRFTYEYVTNYFTEYGCQLLETEYIKNNIKMRYVCICGNISFIRFKDFSMGKRCKNCMAIQARKRNLLTIDEVKKRFLECSCVLLENEYIHAHTKMRYICSCGNEAKITLNNFMNGCRCNNCKCKKLSLIKRGKRPWDNRGNLNPNWNNNLTDEDRLRNKLRRNYIYDNVIWSKSVLERDNYTCKYCTIRGYKLCAHHLNSYHWAIEQRTDINNGITLCVKCHKTFHKIYGNKYNTKDQFIDWINKRSNFCE